MRDGEESIPLNNADEIELLQTLNEAILISKKS
jgi:hypothetical protein